MRGTAPDWTSRAEFYLCLARAFLPPMAPRDFHALTEQLAPALEELGGALGYPVNQPIARLRAAVAAIANEQDLLRHYSRLFLVPPVPAHLNAGIYLDGAVMGRSTLEIEACYRRFGLVRSPEFHDAPDHLSSLLEFLALILARAEAARAANDDAVAGILLHEAGGFARDYIARWLPALARDLDAAAHGPGAAYAALAEVLQGAVARDFAGAPTASGPAVPAGGDEAERPAGDPVRCRECGAVFITTEEMHDILLVLGRAGLGTEHLELCPDCRTRSMGLTGMTPPGLKHLRH